jgi:hypothetical protein
MRLERLIHLSIRFIVLYIWMLSGAFAKLRKSTVTFVVSVCLSVRIELGSLWTDFREIWYLNIFGNLWRKFHVSLKSDNNNAYCAWTLIYTFFYHISLSSSQNEKCFRQKLFRKSKHNIFTFGNLKKKKSCRLWNNVEIYCRAGQQHGSCALHAGYLRLQTHTQNM